MNRLLVVIPFCQKDEVLAAQLLRWMAELQPEGYKPHSCMLAMDHACSDVRKREILALAKPMFSYTSVLQIPVPLDRQSWIPGSNLMFEKTSQTIADCLKMPWLWCEPDCVPLCPGWLDKLAAAYNDSPYRFMGAHVKAVNQPNLPAIHLAGCAIYDADAYHGMKDFVSQQTMAFDINAAEFTVKRSTNSPLFQHFWGKFDLAPTFKEIKAEADPENTIPMGYIRPDAVIWHRCKDGTLIDCLRARRVNRQIPQPLKGYDFEYSGESTTTPKTPVKRGSGRPKKNPEPVSAS